MDIKAKPTHKSLSNDSKKESFGRKNKLWVGSYIFLLLIFLCLYFILKEESLPVLKTYQQLLEKLSLGMCFIMVILIIMKWIERFVAKESKTFANQYNLIRLVRLISLLLILMVIVSILFVNWYAAAVSFGLVSLILSFSLQTPLSSLIGWVYLLIRGTYRIGDRIKLNAFEGDVVEINYMDTTLWETSGEFLTNDVPSGRLIRFPNTMVLQNAVYNYSWEKFPYIWNEIPFFVPVNSDLNKIENLIKDIAMKEIGDKIVANIKQFKEVIAKTTVDEKEIKEFPFVSFNIKGDSWVQATIIYLVEPKKIVEVRSRLIKNILAEMAKNKIPAI